MANHLEDLEAQAKRAVARELAIGTGNLRIPRRGPRPADGGGNMGSATDLTSAAGATTAGIEGDQPKATAVRRRRPPGQQTGTTTRRRKS